MMETGGLWMLLAAGILILATGLPAWIVLVGVALFASVIGIAVGAFTLPILTSLPSRLLGLLEQDLLQALPLYVLMGALLNHLPLADALFRTGSRALRRTGAGAPLAGLGLGVLLAPMNGSVGASVAMLTRTVLPRLDAGGLAPVRGAALVCTASTLGVVVPPSLVLILLGDAMLRAHTEAVNVTHAAVRIVNTQDVFRGVLAPAALLLALCVAITFVTMRDARGALPATPPTRGSALTALCAALVIVSLLTGVTLGYLYAVEAAATGGVALFAYGVVTRALTWPVLGDVLRDTMAVTGALFALLVAATTFTLVLRAFGTDRYVADILTGIGGGEYHALLTVLSLLLLCAFVLDAFEMIFVVIPIVMPPLLIRVPDAVWVATLTLLVLQTSFLVPPVGYAIMMVKGRMRNAIGTGALMRALLPFLVAQLVVLGATLVWPSLVWHGESQGAAAGNPAPTLTDEDMRTLMQRQQDAQEPEPPAGEAK